MGDVVTLVTCACGGNREVLELDELAFGACDRCGECTDAREELWQESDGDAIFNLPSPGARGGTSQELVMLERGYERGLRFPSTGRTLPPVDCGGTRDLWEDGN